MTTDRTQEDMAGVLRRVAKLLAMANDGRGSPEEAAAAAGMAARIMRKYQLEHADVLLADMKANKSEGMTTETVLATAKTNGTAVRAVPTWAQWIAVVVADVNEVHCVMATTARGEVGIRFGGYASDVQVAAWTFAYLIGTVNRLGQAFLKSPHYAVGGRTSANSYRAGVATGICAAIRANKPPAPTTTAGTALVVAKARAIEEEFGEQKRRETKMKAADERAYIAGHADGRRVDVDRRGVGNTQAAGATLIGHG